MTVYKIDRYKYSKIVDYLSSEYIVTLKNRNFFFQSGF